MQYMFRISPVSTAWALMIPAKPSFSGSNPSGIVSG